MADIAVIGVSCRFPGEATSPQKLWDMIKTGSTAWSEFPKDRMNIDGFYHPDGHRQGSISFRGAHFLKEDVAAFDASFFSMTEEDAKAMDPQQRMLLETSYEAFENAGLRMEDLKGSDTSVYVGAFVRDYEQVSLRDMDYQPQYSATGTGTAILSNRISYFFDLHGASMTVDTGCSGSLVAVHLACQNLLSGDSTIALAAGAGLILTPNTMMPMTALNFLSPDGKCFTFDSRANGYGRGEGVGFVVLKKLPDALRDNDPIRAVIRATNLSQDGRTAGITLPSKDAQVFNIRKTYEKAGIDFSRTGYVECHGTGTQAGDVTELTAVSETLSVGRKPDNPIMVGSIKPNIGHLEGAAGVAGLIKAVLVVENGEIPPNANFENGNPAIDFARWNIKVPTAVNAWPMAGLRRASVNCFGFGGTNAHVILDNGDAYVRRYHNKVYQQLGTTARVTTPATVFPVEQKQLFVFSAPERKGLLRLVAAHADHQRGLSSPMELGSLAFTLGCRRSTFEWKTHVVAASRGELVEKLRRVGERDLVKSRTTDLHTAFVFCGQGAQWARMGQGLLVFRPFRKSLEEASEYLAKILGCSFNLLEEMMKVENESHINCPLISQPASTALQVALVDLMTEFGIRPKSVVGHSSGEIAAAYACSMISRETAWALAYYRGFCAEKLRKESDRQGIMCAVGMSADAATEYLQRQNKHTAVQIACINSSESVTLSGDTVDICDIVHDLKEQNVFARRLPVEVAYHSHHMRFVENEYRQFVAGMGPNTAPSQATMFSSVTGASDPLVKIDPDYWVDNMMSPVRFLDAIKAMVSESKPNLILEISPHGTLKGPVGKLISEYFPKKTIPYEALMSRNDGGTQTFLTTIGRLWARGHTINMRRVIDEACPNTLSLKTLTDLPPYPWDHSKTFWHESPITTAYRFRNFGRQDLIGAPTPDSMPLEPRWRGFLRLSENPWLKDHQVQKTIIYPAAGMVVMVIEGARQCVPSDISIDNFEVRNTVIEKSMVVPDTSYGLEVSLNMKQTAPGDVTNATSFEWTIYGRTFKGSWYRHAHGIVHVLSSCGIAYNSTTIDFSKGFQDIALNCKKAVETRHLYEKLDVIGMNYGPTFRNLRSVSVCGNSCVGNITIPDTKSAMPLSFEFDHIIHPATLDSAFHMLLAIDTTPMVPTSIDKISVSTAMPQSPGHELSGYAVATKHALRGVTATLALADSTDRQTPSVIIQGLHMTALSSQSFIPSHHNLCTQMEWKEDSGTASLTSFRKLLQLMVHKYPQLSILQHGGDHRFAKHALNSVVPMVHGPISRIARYTLSCPNSTKDLELLRHMYRSTPVQHVLEHRNPTGDPRSDPMYHIIVFVESENNESQHLEKLLLPDGKVLKRVSNFVCTEEESDSACCSCDDGIDRVTADYEAEGTAVSIDFGVPRSPLQNGDDPPSAFPGIVLLMPEAVDNDLHHLGGAVTAHIRGKDLQVTTTTFDQLAAQSFVMASGKVIISLVELQRDSNEYQVWNWSKDTFDAFHALHATSKSILWVTRGANMKSTMPQNSLVVGLARTLNSEDPESILVTLSLDEGSSIRSMSTSRAIFAALNRSIIAPPPTGPPETEYAEANGKLYIPRLAPVETLNSLIEEYDECKGKAMSRTEKPFVEDRGEACRLVACSPLTGKQQHNEKMFENYRFETDVFRETLESHEVEIQFSSTIIRYADASTMAGHTEEETIGIDVSGIVVGVGSHVKELKVNDEVVALALGGSIRSRLRVDQRFAQKISGGLSTCVPSSWILAYYALFMRFYLRPRHRMLVHHGASLFGQAAIRLARAQANIDVFATIGGKDSKIQRQLLKVELGLEDSHIVECGNNVAWASDLLARTGGNKIDLVLAEGNLRGVGNVMKKTGLNVLIGDMSMHFNTSVQDADTGPHSAVRLNLVDLLDEEPEQIAYIFREIKDRFSIGSVTDTRPIKNFKTFDLSYLPEALRYVGSDSHMSRTALVTADRNTMVSLPTEKVVKSAHEIIHSYGTYVLAGGLGGIGRAIAELLVHRGARNIVFLSRSARKMTSDVADFIKRLRDQGATIKQVQVDICDADRLRGVYESQIKDHMPPVAGVVQCAAVLKDSLFDNMTFDDWESVTRPKTLGSLNLVDIMGQNGTTMLPWFIFLSSSAGVIGNRGQANYAAGNVFMDALAQSGRVPGRAVSLNIGPVLEVGMVADDEETMKKLRESGFYGVRKADLLLIVEKAFLGEMMNCEGRSNDTAVSSRSSSVSSFSSCRSSSRSSRSYSPSCPSGNNSEHFPAQIVLGIGTGGLIRQNQPKDPYWARKAIYAYLNAIDMPQPDLSNIRFPEATTSQVSTSGTSIKSAIASSSSIDEAAGPICEALKAELASLLVTVKVEDVDEAMALRSYGVDSIMAVQIRVWALEHVGASLSVFSILSDSSIADVCLELAEQVLGE